MGGQLLPVRSPEARTALFWGQSQKAHRRASSILVKVQWWPDGQPAADFLLQSICETWLMCGLATCLAKPGTASGHCLWAMEHPAALGSLSAIPEAARAQPAPYLAQRKGADGVGRQLDCVQQGHLDHPVGFRTPARPVLVTLYLQGGEENRSVIAYWLGHLG